MESFDLPEPAPLVVTEHRAHDCQCAACGAKTRAPFPDGVNAPVQYGARTSDGLPCDPSVGSVHATKGMSLVGHQLPLRANAERVRYAPISGLWLKLIDWPKGANSRHDLKEQELKSSSPKDGC
jgi:hypothetical protein